MRFWIIEPAKRATRLFECEDVPDAKREAGLDLVDFGTVSRGIGIIVYEHGLYQDADTHPYFAIGGLLYCGNAVLFGFDEGGATIDLPKTPIPDRALQWFAGRVEIEAAIAAGRVQRPEVRINGVPVWAWPSNDRSWMEGDLL